MTRRQAMEYAIAELGKNGENGGVVTRLSEILAEMPFTSWTDGAVRDGVEQFIADNGYIPSVSDFGKKPLPPHTVIRNRYRMTCGEWMRRNYPKNDISDEEEKQRITAAFLEDYERIRPRSAREFDRNRSASTPCWATVCRHYGVTRWLELLAVLGLETSGNGEKRRNPPGIRVKVVSDCRFRENE